MSPVATNLQGDALLVEASVPAAALMFHRLFLAEKYELHVLDGLVPLSQLLAPILKHTKVKTGDANEALPRASFVFVPPLSASRRADLVRQVGRRLPVKFDYLQLPTPAIQQHAMKALICMTNDTLWHKPTLYYYTPLHPLAADENDVCIDARLNRPFIIKTIANERHAAIVHFGEPLTLTPRALSDAQHAMQTWSRAIRALCHDQRRVILVVDEANLYLNSEKQAMVNAFNQKRLQEARRKQLWAWLSTLVVDAPLYIYVHLYNGKKTSTFDLGGTLAWLHQRHQLDMACSQLLYTGQAPVLTMQQGDDVPAHLKQLNQRPLNDHAAPKTTHAVLNDELQYFPAEQLNMTLKQEISPLIPVGQSFRAKVVEEDEVFQHALLVKDAAMYDAFVAMSLAEQTESNANDEALTAGNHEAVLAIAESLTLQAIKDYIANSGAMARGKPLVDSLFETERAWQGEMLRISGRALGTSPEPYDLHLLLSINKDIQSGLCSCPVGSLGRCKHCVAMLHLFHEKPELFIAVHDETNGKTTIETVKEEDERATTPEQPPATPSTAPEDASSAPTVPQRRVLPWKKAAEEPAPKKRKTRKKVADNDDPDASLEPATSLDSAVDDALAPRKKKPSTTKRTPAKRTPRKIISSSHPLVDTAETSDAPQDDATPPEPSLESKWSPSLVMEDLPPLPKKQRAKRATKKTIPESPELSSMDIGASLPTTVASQSSQHAPLQKEADNGDNGDKDDDDATTDGETTEDEASNADPTQDWFNSLLDDNMHNTSTTGPRVSATQASSLGIPMSDLDLSHTLVDSGSDTEDDAQNDDETEQKPQNPAPRRPIPSTMELFDELGI
ncbi:hypothetical protein BC940DRAFT_291397 [Gongronella butleri]|nr:hypothetical protein BC940DRAFT_291397 [Gongronella butleri]